MILFLLLLTALFMVLSFYFRSQVLFLTVMQESIKKDDVGSVKGITKDIKSKDINIKNVLGHSAVLYGNKLSGGAVSKALKATNKIDKHTGGSVTKGQQKQIEFMRRARNWADIGFGVMVIVDILYVVFIFLVIMVVLVPVLVMGAGLFEDNDTIAKAPSSISTTKGTATEVEDSSSSWVEGDTSPPPGVDEEDWNSTDEMGKVLAKTAYNASIMDFPAAGGKDNASPSGGLRYMQGDTPIGYYDCSTFVSGVLEANGILSNGSGKRSGGNYDFNTMRKADLQNYEYTGAEIASWSKMADPVTNVGTPGWEDKVKPGDLVVNANHVAVFVGKNKAGEPVIAHAASGIAGNQGTVIYKDYDRKVPTYEVGLNIGEAEITAMFPGTSGMVFRPSQMYGNL